MILNEIQKDAFLSKARPDGRYARRLSVGNASINKIGVLEMSQGKPNLDIIFDVSGSEGGSYEVSVGLNNFMDNLRYMYQDYVLQNGNINSISRKDLRELVKIVLRACLTNGDLRLACTCPDYRYRFAYLATTMNYNFSSKDAEHRPAKVTNPNNKGSGCKHLVRVLTSTSKWQPKVITAVVNMIVQNPGLLRTK